MKYKISKIKLRKVAEGKRNAGSLFVQFTVRNPDNRLDKGEVTVFDEDFAADYEEYYALSEPGVKDGFGQQTWQDSKLKDPAKPCPEDLLVATHAQFEQYIFPGGPRVALDDEGKPRRNDRGRYIVQESIWVFTWKALDNETGELRYIRGWDPASRGASIMNNLYGPMSLIAESNQPMGVVLPMNPGTPLTPPLTNGETAAPAGATPTATPTV